MDPWSAPRAWARYDAQSWLRGLNYVPSSAINPIETWARKTFDAATVERKWAGPSASDSTRRA